MVEYIEANSVWAIIAMLFVAVVAIGILTLAAFRQK